MAILSLIELLHLAPGPAQIAHEAATQKDIEVFVTSRVRMFGPARHFHAREMFPVAGPVAAEHDHVPAIVIPRAPQPIALMIADRFRQTKARAEEIDRTSLAVTVGKDRGLGARIRRK